jgi:hypothetical protein
MTRDELAADISASKAIALSFTGNLPDFIQSLSRDSSSPQPRQGSVAAVADTILLDISSDYKLRKAASKKHENFDSREIEKILAAG